MKKAISYTILFFILISCSNVSNGLKKKVIARVSDKRLYINDFVDLIPKNISSGDSIVFIRNYADKWVKDQLLLIKAKQNLGEKQNNLKRQIERNKTRLYIYHYQQDYIKQEMDSIVSEEEIEDYFNEYLKDFRLSQNIVKALYIKVPRESKDIQQIKLLYKTDINSDLDRLKQLCNKENTVYEDFQNSWQDFIKILSITPSRISNKERFLRTNSTIEESDSLYFYFVHIKEYKLFNAEAPIDFIKERIIDIILNKRKIRLLEVLENNLYDQAIRTNEVEILIDQ